jgi:hypothetical protein
MTAPLARLRPVHYRLAAAGAALLVVLLVWFLVFGDSGSVKTYPVRGSFKVNGEPAAGAILYFHLVGDWFQITDVAISSLQAANVPGHVLSKLGSLKGETYTRDELTKALESRLSKEDFATCQELVFKHASLTILPQATTEPDGSFVVHTFAANDGAPAGEYEISVYWPQPRKGWKPSKDRLHDKLQDPKKTGLRARVEPKDNVLPPIEIAVDLTPPEPDPMRPGTTEKH